MKLPLQKYIVYCKLFEVEKFCSCKTKLQFAGKHSRLDGSLAWPNPVAQATYFTGKVSWLPINPRKPQLFTLKNLLMKYDILMEVYVRK